MNLAALVALFVVSVAYPDANLVQIDGQIGQGVQAAAVVFGYIVQLLSSKGTHEALRSVPVVGTSLTVGSAQPSPDKRF